MATFSFNLDNLQALKAGINEILDVFIDIMANKPKEEQYMHKEIQKKLRTIVSKEIFKLIPNLEIHAGTYLFSTKHMLHNQYSGGFPWIPLDICTNRFVKRRIIILHNQYQGTVVFRQW